MLLRASVVVCHGGAGVTFKAPAHGVPVCAAAFGRDQLEVARRLERTGAGPPASATPAGGDGPSRGKDAPRSRGGMRPARAAGGAAAAADALEAALVSGPPTSRSP